MINKSSDRATSGINDHLIVEDHKVIALELDQ
jgi:hypothetical protein